MSATNRGRERQKDDFYRTPSWCVQRLLEKLELPRGNWLEPGAGDGSIIETCLELFGLPGAPNFTALEIREDSRQYLELVSDEVIITPDFLNPPGKNPLDGRRFDVGLGNPPFLLAMDFIDTALNYCDNVVFLLRLNFFGSKWRQPWIQSHMPDVYILPNRPSFDGIGSDATEYGWFHWTPGERTEGKVVMLDLTPDRAVSASRQAAKAATLLAQATEAQAERSR